MSFDPRQLKFQPGIATKPNKIATKPSKTAGEQRGQYPPELSY